MKKVLPEFPEVWLLPFAGDEFLVFIGVQAMPEWPLGGDVVEEIKIPDSGKRKL